VSAPDKAQIERAASLIKAASDVLIVSHENPDGDAIGSTLAMLGALKEAGKRATAYNANKVPYFLDFLPGADEIINELPGGDAAYDLIIFLDSSSLDRFGGPIGENYKRLCRGQTIKIDHHETLSPFADVEIIDAESASTGELVFAFLKENGFVVSPQTATCLYCALATDTGFFRFSNVKAQCFETAGELLKLGADAFLVADRFYNSQPIGQLKMTARVLGTLETHCGGQVAFIHSRKEWEAEFGVGSEVYEGFSNLPRSVKGVRVAVFFKESSPRKYKLSIRSSKDVNVAKVAEAFGGGGHKSASGATLEMPLDEAKAAVLAEIKKRL